MGSAVEGSDRGIMSDSSISMEDEEEVVESPDCLLESSEEDCLEEEEEDTLTAGLVVVKEENCWDFCGQTPCDWETYVEAICELFDELKDSGMENNQVQF